jgi:lipoate-protein ligase A
MSTGPMSTGPMSTGPMSTGWIVEHAHGSARHHHELDIAAGAPRVRVCTIDARALVLGSSQPVEAVDDDAVRQQRIDVVRRRSGGGAVLVAPDAQVWLDLWVPTGHALWSPDVIESFAWLGETWVRALATCGIDGSAHRGRLESGRWGSVVCFAGLGPGEVTVAGRKVVGLSQHRSRAGARFHAAALLRWELDELLVLLRLDESARAEARRDLTSAAAGIPVDAAALGRAFLAQLPTG